MVSGTGLNLRVTAAGRDQSPPLMQGGPAEGMGYNQGHFDALDLEGFTMIGYEPALQDPHPETLGAVSRRDSILALIGLCAGVLVCASGGLGAICSNSGALGDWFHDHG